MDNLYRLVKIMETLRDPQQGCAWDVQQTFETIAPYTIEEVYEVIDAIDQKDYVQLQDELGDLLLQVVYHSQMAREQNLFNFDDVAKSISDKLIRRHPHVFDEQVSDVKKSWEEIKQQERNAKNKNSQKSILDDIPLALPQLMRAKKIQKRAAMVGFDWKNIGPVLDKVKEELVELEEAINVEEKIEEELGDLLFSIVNLSRHLQLNAENALRKGNQKFIQRFNCIEEKAKSEAKALKDYSLDELEAMWQEAKREVEVV